ncbi:MAG: hypothetical protein OXK16_00180, partial [bacterium]|nr:hypothetical protein [bacterium]
VGKFADQLWGISLIAINGPAHGRGRFSRGAPEPRGSGGQGDTARLATSSAYHAPAGTSANPGSGALASL